jgi:hypothetical protein
MMNYAKLYTSLWVVYACCMAIPFSLENQKERINAVSNGNLGHVLKSSLVLKIFEGISIGSVTFCNH